MSNSASYIFLNNELIQQQEAMIPAVTSGLYYGAGCFETFVSENGKILRFTDHIQRLNNGLNYLGLREENMIDHQKIFNQIKRLLQKNELSGKKAKIRIQASLTGESGYSAGDNSLIILLITSELIDNEKQPKNLVLSETSVVPSSARPSGLKLSNMLHYRHAFREAKKLGADDAILLNVDSFIAETSIANIFWKEEDKVFTPSNECDILPGIMRSSVIKTLKDNMNVEVNEGKYSLDNLMEADLVWLTNSVLDFCPVESIEEVSFKTDDPFYFDLNDQLSAFKAENVTYV